MISLRSRMTFLSFLLFMGTTLEAMADPTTASTSVSEIHGRIGDPMPEGPPVGSRSEDMPAVGKPRFSALDAASTGAFLPLTIGASTEATYGQLLSGYDGGRGAMVYEGAADARIVDRLSVRAGYSSHDLSGHASVLFGGRFQLLSQKQQGVDVGVGLFYLPQGIDGEGLVRGSAFVGRHIGKVALFGSVSYGQDPEGDDHHAELSVASLVPLSRAVLVGVDARMRALVATSDSKHTGAAEPLVDVALGPLAHYVLGPIVLTSQVGMSAVAIREPQGAARSLTEMRYGALGLVSAGCSL